MSMTPWRVTIVDGLFQRYQGFGVVLAATADEARETTVKYLKHNTAYGKPFEVSQVEPHEHAEPHVVYYEWGGPYEWPHQYADYDLEPPEEGLPPTVAPKRFTAPDGQSFMGERKGRLFVSWPERDENDRYEAYWDKNDHCNALVPLALTLGFQLGRDEFPPWLEELEIHVTHHLAGYDSA